MSNQIEALKEFMKNLSDSNVDHFFVMFPYNYKDNAFVTKVATYHRMVVILEILMKKDEHFFPALRQALEKFMKDNDTDHKAMQELMDDVMGILNQQR